MTNPETQNTAPADGTSSTRRSLLTKLWVLLGIVALAELIGLVFAFFKPRKQRMGAADLDSLVLGMGDRC